MNSGHVEFVDLYEEVKHKLFTFLNYRVNFDQALAEDLMMDIVLKAYENFDKFDRAKGAFISWIFSISHNHLKNHWRSLSRQMISLDELQENGFSPSVEADIGETNNSIDQINTYKVLDMMKPEEKEIIVMKYINEMKNDEIAEAMGKKEGAVRTQITRALQRFEEYYKKIYPNLL